MRRTALALFLLPALLAGAARAQQGYCASDGQPRPRALLERFISADCQDCWSDPASPRAAARELALDWVVPSSRGDEAPLSPAAARDALERLDSLGRTAPARADSLRQRLVASARTLRVSHGTPVNDYIGTSIELRPAGRSRWDAWLLLVETIPAGTEGTPIERNLVRNAFRPAWNGPKPPTQAQQKRLFEQRPMRIPDGADPARLRVVAWVADPRGRIRAISKSRCQPGGGQR